MSHLKDDDEDYDEEECKESSKIEPAEVCGRSDSADGSPKAEYSYKLQTDEGPRCGQINHF